MPKGAAAKITKAGSYKKPSKRIPQRQLGENTGRALHYNLSETSSTIVRQLSSRTNNSWRHSLGARYRKLPKERRPRIL